MKKIMFYCQYLAGMGHLVRSTEIIRSLVPDFQVCFVNGGQPIAEFELPAQIEVVHLPAILEEAGELKAVDASADIEVVKQHRIQQLLAVFDRFQPDCLITECFPFSKHRVKFELQPLLDRAKSASHPVRIVCSLRDLVMTQALSPEAWDRKYEKVCNLVNRYYDLILFHGDPQLQTLADFFPLADRLTAEVYYTGYVSQSPPETPLGFMDAAHLSQSTPRIVASVGGGRFGYDLLNALKQASPILARSIPHQVYAFAGPWMPEAQFQALQQGEGSEPVPAMTNFTIRRFTPHLIQYMQTADLSISLGGYNTTMNILKTGVRALVFPFISENQAGEQSIRAEKLEQLGVLQVVHPADLTGDRLADKILTYLQQQPSPHSFNLEGAANSADRLKALLCQQPIAV
ncbi:MAG: glycosyl transferase [Elainella sp. Prado103]|nr:glycosyl transferase [Elainella sp. Prado103]